MRGKNKSESLSHVLWITIYIIWKDPWLSMPLVFSHFVNLGFSMPMPLSSLEITKETQNYESFGIPPNIYMRKLILGDL